MNYQTCFTVVVLLIMAGGALGGEPGEVSVRSSGEVFVEPNRVFVVFDILEKGETSQIATERAQLVYHKALQGIKSLGFTEEDITTTRFRVLEDKTRDYKTGEQAIVGYKSEHSFKLKLSDFLKIGPVVNAAVGAGASRVSDIRFWSTETADSYDIALKLGVESARRKAQIMAESIGGELGKLISITADKHRMDTPLSAGGNAATSVPVVLAPGPIKVQVDVSAKWALKE